MHSIDVRSHTNPVTQPPVSTLRTADVKIEGTELLTKSAIAVTLGVVPFIISKLGELLVKGTAYTVLGCSHLITDNTDKNIGSILSDIFKIAISPLAISAGACLFGGAAVFAITQQLVWGKELVDHPQEEKINTQLARYGASGKPGGDFLDLCALFLIPSLCISQEEDENIMDVELCKLRDFQAT